MFKVIYYSKNGKIPIVDFLKTLPNKDQVKILREIDLLEQYGFSLGMPYIKKNERLGWFMGITHQAIFKQLSCFLFFFCRQ